jgi:hypothetical protein
MQDHHTSPLIVGADEPVIAVPIEQDGKEVVAYFRSEAEAAAALAAKPGASARSVKGAWADLDWEDAKRQLDRIRHESEPTPPIDL